MTSHHGTVVAWAAKNEGQHEVPMGSNTGPFVVACQRATGLPGTNWPWCAAFARRAWQVAGVEVPYTGASAWGLLDYYTANRPGWVVPRAMWGDAKPGAFVVFNIGSGHVALLERPIKPGDTTVTTIGGNESDSVKETTRPLSDVRGIVDPPEGAPPVKPMKPKTFEVASSESGHRKLIYVSGGKAISRHIERILNRHGGITITRKR